MEPWIDLATRLGVPTAILAAVLWYHARVVRDKDTELSRINELRVKEANEMSDKMLVRDKEHLGMLGDVDKTLTLLLERLK